jgi:CheY-like chemotaxis protein
MILVVDDERSVADTLAAILQLAGYSSTAVYSGEEGLQFLQSVCPALILTDVVMPGMDGVEFAVQARTRCPGARILLISGNAATLKIVESARRRGYCFELLAKPVPPRELLAKVASLLPGASVASAGSSR